MISIDIRGIASLEVCTEKAEGRFVMEMVRRFYDSLKLRQDDIKGLSASETMVRNLIHHMRSEFLRIRWVGKKDCFPFRFMLFFAYWLRDPLRDARRRISRIR